MKKESKEVRNKMVVVRMNEAEFSLLEKLQKQTTENHLSYYMRKVLLQKPLTVKYRNASADDFLKEMMELNKQLAAVGNNFNQAVKKLHVLEKIPEFRGWLLIYERDREAVQNKIEIIHSHIIQLHEQWLQG